MKRTLIADDHAVVREGLKCIIEGAEGFGPVGEASDLKQVVSLARDQRWDVVLLDLNMPGGSPFETIRQIKNYRPQLPVLVISSYPEERYAVRSIRAGASGYLSKSAPPQTVLTALSKVASGGRYITPRLADRLFDVLQAHGTGPAHEQLSDREFDVLLRLAGGRAVNDIAEELSLSPKTVSTYRARVLDKMGLSSNAELTRYALEHELLE